MTAATTFHGTPVLARRAARVSIRRARRGMPGRTWDAEWRLVSSALAAEMLAGRDVAADRYLAAVVLRLARWEAAAARVHRPLVAGAFL